MVVRRSQTYSWLLALAALALWALAGDAWAGGLDGASGGGAKPPAAPGRSGGSRGDLGNRRARTRWLRDSGGQPQASGAPTAPSTPRGTPAAPPRDAALVYLHHGSVRMVGGLARVDLTLEVRNPTARALEWSRTYAVDPAAEVIGAVLLRRNEIPLIARTLTGPDAARCYAQVRTPRRERPRTRPPRSRDPLMVQRPQSDRLAIRVWPVAAHETVRVKLAFVTPLRGHGAHRTYVDVMGGPVHGPDAPRRISRPETPREPRHVTMVDARADWLMSPGNLVLSSAPATGMTLDGQVGGRLQFRGTAATRPDQPAPTVPFLSPELPHHALLVGARSWHGRVAVWRFDPRGFLAAKGFVVGPELRLRLRPVKGNCRHVAPAVFAARGEPLPVTAQLVDADADALRYEVDVLDPRGVVLAHEDVALPLRRDDVDGDLAAAVTGWHRAQLAKRVFRWAGALAGRRTQALRYAVDLGVLLPGTAALGIPPAERNRLTSHLRRLYLTDGVPLGAPRGEADLKLAPLGSLDR
jgi:hypothetical protein